MMTSHQALLFIEKAKALSDLRYSCENGSDGIRLASVFLREHWKSRMFAQFVQHAYLMVPKGDSVTTEFYFDLAQKLLCIYNTWKGQSKGQLKISFDSGQTRLSKHAQQLLQFRLWWAVYRGFPNSRNLHPYTHSHGFRVTNRLDSYGEPITNNDGTPEYLKEHSLDWLGMDLVHTGSGWLSLPSIYAL